MNKTKFILSVALFLLTTGLSAHAGFSPVSLSLVPPVQFPADDFSITGARLSILYGHQRDMYGIDLGVLGNITEQDFVGIAASGIFNRTKGETTVLGLQLAGMANINTGKTHVYGVQAALGLNMNTAESSSTGLALALANLSPHTKIYGFQVGIYNEALAVYGFQIGLVNVCENLHGLQIGLVNFHRKGLFSVAPILNVGF
jgi:hypothetical protein